MDLVIAGLLAVYLVRGMVKGLIAESLAFLGVLIAALAALLFAGQVSAALARDISLSPRLLLLIALGLVFCGVNLLSILGVWYLGRGKGNYVLSGMDRAGGAVVGCVKGTFVLSLLVTGVSVLPLFPGLRKAVVESPLAGEVRPFAPTAYEAILFLLPSSARERYEGLRMVLRDEGKPARKSVERQIPQREDLGLERKGLRPSSPP